MDTPKEPITLAPAFLGAMEAKDIIQMDGVKDLPFKARGLFALSLKSEAQGEHEKAMDQLARAIVAEDEARKAS